MQVTSFYALAGALALVACASQTRTPGSASTGQPCDPDNGGITVPAGFCARVFADSLPGPRHLIVAPNGDVIVALRGVRGTPGGVVALRDTDGDGRADRRARFGSWSSSEVALRGAALYVETGTEILRFPWPAGALEPAGAPDTIVSGLPSGGHSAKTFALDSAGNLFINIGSRTNACQQNDRQPQSPGIDPCTELETRAGIWRFDASRLRQQQSDGERWATGIRNAVAIAINPLTGGLYVVQHGRDQLGGARAANWPALYTDAQNAELPAEEMFQIERGDDFGWPYCYFDPQRRRKVLAPEYDGDGEQTGRCEGKKGNIAYFPAHWGPNALLFYSGHALPQRYRGGAFIAFHGSWNRAPLPQAGFNVVFVPMIDGRPGNWEVFADGFMAPELRSASATQTPPDPTLKRHRPTGLAEGPDGALYITDDGQGRIWRVTYIGNR